MKTWKTLKYSMQTEVQIINTKFVLGMSEEIIDDLLIESLTRCKRPSHDKWKWKR